MPCFGMGSDLIKLGSLILPEAVPALSGRQETRVRVNCPECGWEITSDFTWCPQCGVRTKPYQCAYCRGWVPVGMEVCPRCGAPEN